MIGLERDQAAELRIAVLLDDEDAIMLLEELHDLLAERERADAAVVDVDPLVGQLVEPLVDAGTAAAEGHDAPIRRLPRLADHGLGHQLRGRGPLRAQPVDYL